jgi:hypothetical protein
MRELERARIPPFVHQIVGIKSLVDHPFFLLADEMGAGKTKQVIDAACVLFIRGVIEKVLVITPAAVRSVWFDPEWGELKKHLWDDVPSIVWEYHAKLKKWVHGPEGQPKLRWVVTNYDYIRHGIEPEMRENRKGKMVKTGRKLLVGRLFEVSKFCGSKTLLVLDESSAVKTHTSKQTKACFALRQMCGRVILINGTPITNSPGDMYSQGQIMSTRILECKSFTYFRSRYGVMGGFENREIVKWVRLDDLQRRFAPYVIRRLKKDCLDLPEKMPPVIRQTPLSEELWKIYKEMRDDLVTWITESKVATAQLAITKSLRLQQITSGFLGGVEEALPDAPPLEDAPDYFQQVMGDLVHAFDPLPKHEAKFIGPVLEIGRDKLNGFLEWYDEARGQKPNLKMIVWCAFKAEVDQTLEALTHLWRGVELAPLYGDNKKADRDRVLRLLDPRTAPDGPVVVAGTLGTGSLGLTLTAADTNWYRSIRRSRLAFVQSQDRTHRPTQVNPVSYYYQLATGPKGQKTIDHLILRSMENMDYLANMTESAWVKALMEE